MEKSSIHVPNHQPVTIHRSFRPHTSPLPRSMFTHLIGRYSAFILDPTANLVKSGISPRFVDFTCATGLPQFRTWIQNAIALSNYRYTSGNQAWLAGKSHRNGHLNNTIIYTGRCPLVVSWFITPST